MQSPVIVLDHINHVVLTVGVDPKAEERIAEVVAGQQQVISAAGGSPPEK
jgi:hypothetical protein